ncbi:MAG: response regulator [Geminicoccaceae bacterium]
MAVTAKNREQAKIVLIGEDELSIRTVLAEHLHDCGFEVMATANTHEAMQMLRDGVLIDVLFADVRMPGEINGFGLTSRVRQNCPKVRIIMISGVDRAAHQASDLCGRRHNLSRPTDPASLAAEIRRLAGRLPQR